MSSHSKPDSEHLKNPIIDSLPQDVDPHPNIHNQEEQDSMKKSDSASNTQNLPIPAPTLPHNSEEIHHHPVLLAIFSGFSSLAWQELTQQDGNNPLENFIPTTAFNYLAIPAISCITVTFDFIAQMFFNMAKNQKCMDGKGRSELFKKAIAWAIPDLFGMLGYQIAQDIVDLGFPEMGLQLDSNYLLMTTILITFLLQGLGQATGQKFAEKIFSEKKNSSSSGFLSFLVGGAQGVVFSITPGISNDTKRMVVNGILGFFGDASQEVISNPPPSRKITHFLNNKLTLFPCCAGEHSSRGTTEQPSISRIPLAQPNGN